MYLGPWMIFWYNLSTGKGKKPSHRWKDNINMDLQEVGWRGMDWIYLAKDRDRWRALVNAVMKLRVPINAGNFLIS
jgi:hypothetical protein